MPIRPARFLWLLVALGGGAFAACSSDNFGNDHDSGSPVEAGGPDVCAGDCDAGSVACIVGGTCQPVVLATGLHGPYGIDVRGSSLYVTEFVPHGRILRFDKNGGTNQTPNVVATETTMGAAVPDPGYVSQPFSVGANATHVAWTDLGGQATTGFAKVFYAPLADAGAVTAFYQLCGEGEIAVNDTQFFWANQATPKCLRPEQNGLFRGSPISGHNGTVYFPVNAPGDDAGLGGLLTDGGPSVLPLAVALDGNRVYVGAGSQLLIFDADKIDNPNGVTGAQVGGSTALPGSPYAIATDFDTVVWTDNRLSGSVYALVKNAAENTAPTVLTKNESGPLGIAVDGPTKYVYYTTYGDGKLMRARKSGLGSPEVVLSGLDHPAFMTSDATSLYFTTFGSGQADGTLVRVTKPLN